MTIPGSKNGAAKLEERDVRAIRLLYAANLYTPTELAARWNVSRELIHKIVRRDLWKHVE